MTAITNVVRPCYGMLLLYSASTVVSVSSFSDIWTRDASVVSLCACLNSRNPITDMVTHNCATDAMSNTLAITPPI